MIKVAICDEEEAFAKEVYSVLSDISKSRNINVVIDVFRGTDKLLSEFKKNHYNIVFFSVDSEVSNDDKSKLNLAKYIKSIGNNIQIIFFSRTEKYALEGYEIGISNYFLKPDGEELSNIDKEKIESEFLKVLSKIDKEVKRIFIIKKKVGIKILSIDDILFFEAHNRVITVVTKYEKIDFYDKINDLEERLKDNSFLRCHRAFLVNPKYVKELTKDAIYLEYNYTIPVSRLRSVDVRNHIINYLDNNINNNELLDNYFFQL